MNELNVEVVYVPKDKDVVHIHLRLAEGSTVADALHKANLFNIQPETIDMPVGIFGTVVPLTHLVKSGDRIEIYRSLMNDPKEKRRQRARLHK